jgi:4-hydroxybenzoate polyprenyltransferase
MEMVQMTSDEAMPAAHSGTRDRARLADYVRIARLDHMTKHVFIVPGVALAALLRSPPDLLGSLLPNLVLGFASAVLVASANYVINEYLDRDFDRFHPEKSHRAAVQREMSGSVVTVEWAVLVVAGLGLAALVNVVFFFAAVLLAVSGLTYNVRPLRSKDRVYIDVLSESLNNPIRLIMGWAMADDNTLPPASLMLAFWFGGAFLMNSKRLAEYRDIIASDGAETLARYRRSFRFYTEGRLSVANLVYALLCSFFIAVFLIKYRIEYIFVFPGIVALFAVYYALALTPGSVARKPEKLYRSWPVMGTAALTALLFAFASSVDIPVLDQLTSQTFIEVRNMGPAE